jgi:O6-methylguanine-DNA--protein-cysteine methyltransferase
MIRPSRLLLDEIATPIGTFAILADGDGRLCAAGFVEGHDGMERRLVEPGANFERAANPGGLSAALSAYFAGNLAALDGLPVAANGTEFQLKVWSALREIPCGETRSYGDIARRIGKPSVARRGARQQPKPRRRRRAVPPRDRHERQTRRLRRRARSQALAAGARRQTVALASPGTQITARAMAQTEFASGSALMPGVYCPRTVRSGVGQQLLGCGTVHGGTRRVQKRAANEQ